MFLRVATVLLAIAALGAADTLTLRSGQVVRGQYVGGDARRIRMAVGDRVETYSVEDVAGLAFGGGQRLSSGDNDRPNTNQPNNDRPTNDQSTNDQSNNARPPADQPPPAAAASG